MEVASTLVDMATKRVKEVQLGQASSIFFMNLMKSGSEVIVAIKGQWYKLRFLTYIPSSSEQPPSLQISDTCDDDHVLIFCKYINTLMKNEPRNQSLILLKNMLKTPLNVSVSRKSSTMIENRK